MAWTTNPCLICCGVGKIKKACDVRQIELEEFTECVACEGKGHFRIWIDPYNNTSRNKRWGIVCD